MRVPLFFSFDSSGSSTADSAVKSAGRIPAMLSGLALALCGAAGALFAACEDGAPAPQDLSGGPADMAQPTPDMAVSVTAPVVSSIDVKTSSVTGGGTATISGSKFSAGATVSFGAVSAAVNSIAPDGTSISVTIPASPSRAGLVDIVVTNSNGEKGTLVRGFKYSLNTVVFANAAANPTLNLMSTAGPRSVIQVDARAN
jgi:hypothetical protein